MNVDRGRRSPIGKAATLNKGEQTVLVDGKPDYRVPRKSRRVGLKEASPGDGVG